MCDGVGVDAFVVVVVVGEDVVVIRGVVAVRDG